MSSCATRASARASGVNAVSSQGCAPDLPASHAPAAVAMLAISAPQAMAATLAVLVDPAEIIAFSPQRPTSCVSAQVCEGIVARNPAGAAFHLAIRPISQFHAFAEPTGRIVARTPMGAARRGKRWETSARNRGVVLMLIGAALWRSDFQQPGAPPPLRYRRRRLSRDGTAHRSPPVPPRSWPRNQAGLPAFGEVGSPPSRAFPTPRRPRARRASFHPGRPSPGPASEVPERMARSAPNRPAPVGATTRRRS